MNTTKRLSTIEYRLKIERNSVIRERLLLVKAYYEEDSYRGAAERCGVSHAKVRYWKLRYERQGAKGLETAPHPGRPRELDGGKEIKIKRAVLRKSARTGWQTVQLKEYIAEESGVRYTERHVMRIAARWGLSLITPRPRFAASSDRERSDFLKGEYADI